MPISNISRVKTITLKINADSNNIQVVYSNNNLAVGGELIPNHKIISFNCFVKNLRVFANVPTLEEAPLPDYQLTDTATAKLVKTIDIEWKSPRKQLNLYITNAINPTNNDWLQVGSLSLINPYGYPFRVYNILDLFTDNLALELGENGKIGINVQDVGYGLITDNDRVVVHGSYVEEVFVETPQAPNVFNINLSGNTAGSNTNTPNEPTVPNYSVGNSSLIDNAFLLAN
ncbi:hypothetical protein [Aliterella atlantica]|uniref:Uncharacterized protein n=1 Tax=Aliterella atlantica CENA595 TaxID=1618023 RepID=A0A0D8ZLW6_9CYAN|nr:hypothetical protein [Aliterella atlantica]KJH69392.1 hypothetical protein UH38_24115 [Aliterella atlantica CENA595]